jgi:hypothetical protein
MRLYMHHGRLDPNGGATDEDGNEIDDWGFTGPDLPNVEGMHVTYTKMRLFFVDEAAKAYAKALTGWDDGHGDNDLFVPQQSDCLKEFFGDWGIAAGVVQPGGTLPTIELSPLRGAAWDTER